MRKVSYREFLENYVDTATVGIAITITGNLLDGEQLDIEMSPDFVADVVNVFRQEAERIVEAIELERALEESLDD